MQPHCQHVHNLTRAHYILQVLAIEFVLLAIDFVPLANEFILLANEFVPLANEFVPLAIEFVALAFEFVTLAFWHENSSLTRLAAGVNTKTRYSSCVIILFEYNCCKQLLIQKAIILLQQLLQQH